MGGGESRLSKQFFEQHANGLDWSTFTSRVRDAYSGLPETRTKLYPGVAETLRELDMVPGLTKIVVTNRMESLAAATLRDLGILSYFNGLVGGDSGAGRKPSPGPLLYALSQAGTTATDAVMVGDCIYDIEAGRAAGIRTIAVTYGYGNNDFALRADFIIDKFRQILDVLAEPSSAAE